jgi:DHA1 family bicyclomycin/chloramphenicol resistance-like MFS transporter
MAVGKTDRPPRALIVTVLGLLFGLQPVTTDLYLPALPGLAAELGAGMPRAQMTLAALILAFGLGQLLLGPLADRFGRRPVLIGGLLLYAAAALGAAAAPGIDALIGWRALQGVGLAAGVVCARAMVRDFHAPEDGARVMTAAMTGLGLCALASPLAGGAVAAAFGWRASLWVTAIVAGLALVLIVGWLPESAPRHDTGALDGRALWQRWSAIVRHPGFRNWASMLALTYGSLYTFLAGSAFVFIGTLGVSQPVYGAVLAFSSLSYIAGTLICQRWLRRGSPAQAVRRGAAFTIAAVLAFAALALGPWHPPWAIALAQGLFMLGHGVHQPCGQAGVVAPFPQAAGAAAALSGFVLAAAAFGIGLWLGIAADRGAAPVLLTQATFGALVAWLALGPLQAKRLARA